MSSGLWCHQGYASGRLGYKKARVQSGVSGNEATHRGFLTLIHSFSRLCVCTCTSEKRAWLRRLTRRHVLRGTGHGAPDTEGRSWGSAFLITFSKAEGPQWQWRRWSAGTSRFPGREGLSQEGGLFPRTGESFPGDRPQHAQFPVGKYLKIGNYRIASVIITLRWNSPCYDSYCLLVRNHVDSEITASRRGWPVSGSTCQVSSHSTALSLAPSLETMGLCAGAEAKKLEGNLHASSTPPPTPPPRCLLFCFQIGWVQWLTPPPSSLC